MDHAHRRPPSGSRRSFLLKSAAGAGSLWLASQWPHLAEAQVADRLIAPPWDAVPTCTASNTDGAGQGPFFIHNREKDDDVDMFRQDIRGRFREDAEPGTEMQLHLRVLNTTADCLSAEAPRAKVDGKTPVAGIDVYVWHTDAQGYYSGFGEPGEQTPDVQYAGKPGRNDLDNALRFCRGAGVTDANGVVSFRSIFPGWYNGRDVHIHVLAIHSGSESRGRQTYRDRGHILTTQFYFEPDLIDRVHKASQPYLRRTALPAYAGAIRGDERNNSGLRARASFDGKIVVAQMQISLDPNASRV